MSNLQCDLAVVVGRFQSPYLHKGHRAIIGQALRLSKKVLVCIGTTGMNPTETDPLSFKVRRNMIASWYRNWIQEIGAELIIEEITDHPFSDKTWSENLDEIIKKHCSSKEVILVGGRDSFVDRYHGTYPTYKSDLVLDCCASDIRAKIGLDLIPSIEDSNLNWFHNGMIHAHNTKPYPNIYPTVDAIIWRERNNEHQVLLGRKKGEDQWRTPGGFVNVTDESYEQAVLREAHEECGFIELDKPSYVGSAIIDDVRYRKVRDKVFSTFFSLQFIFGNACPGDDLSDLKWFSMSEVVDLSMIKEHKQYIQIWYNTLNPLNYEHIGTI